MGRLFLTGDDADFDLLEPCPFEPTVQVAFGESEPAVAVKFAGLIEMVLEQVEDHDLAAGLEDAMTRGNGPGRLQGVMQRLAQDDQVHALRLDGRFLQIAQAKLQILQAVPGLSIGAGLWLVVPVAEARGLSVVPQQVPVRPTATRSGGSPIRCSTGLF